MGFSQKLSAGVKKHLSNLNEAHDRRVAAADAKAKRQLEVARTKTDREKVRLQLARDKLNAKKELFEARAATRKAKIAMQKARKEAGDLTIGERLGSAYRGLQSFTAPPKKRVVKKRKVIVKRKVVEKKAKISKGRTITINL